MAERFFVMMFKVNDRVKVTSNGIKGYKYDHRWKGSLGTVTSEVNSMGALRVRLDNPPRNTVDVHDCLDGLWCDVDCVKRLSNEPPKNEVQTPCELRFTFADNKTTASLVDTAGNVVCTTIAQCHPNDEWNAGKGVAIALDRLCEKHEKQVAERSSYKVGDVVKLKKGAPLPLFLDYGGSATAMNVIFDTSGTVKDVSPNGKNVTVKWGNVVALVPASSLERGKRKLKKPLWRKGDILITSKNGCFVRVIKDYYHGDNEVEFETTRGNHGKLTADKFSGSVNADNRIKVGDMVEALDNGWRTRGIVTDVKPMNSCPWMNYVLINGVDGKVEVSRLYREERVRPLGQQREPFVGETVYVFNEGISHEHISEREVLGERARAGEFCEAVERDNWLGGDAFRVKYRGKETYVDPHYVIILNE